jgi:outer membrane protein OmpA-like peptidoglycan-associated protein
MRALLVLVALTGCVVGPEKVEPFPPLEIKVAPVEAPPPPPPKVVVTRTKIELKGKVQFKTNSAEILQESYSLLDDAARVITQNPQITLIQVEGHTDAVGPAAYNRQLSQQRAEAVVKYFIEQGIDSKRLVPKGFGPDRPIGDNATDEGRELNRRVELNILEQGERK